jgi:arylformamidase
MNLESLSDEEVEAQLNPRVAVRDAEQHLAEFAARSRAARQRLDGRLDIAYGDSRLQTLDAFPARAGKPPLHVFIHGGYWRALDKSDHSFVAEPLVAGGASTVILNYDLCPSVTVDHVVRQVRRGLAWIYHNAAEVGGDRDRLFVSGHSAGAQLAVMALNRDWLDSEGLPADTIKGVVAISGVYELAPVMRVSVNEEIRLTEEMAERNSPTLHPPDPLAPILVAVGGDEPPGWIRQSVDFFAVCRKHGVVCDYMQVPGAHHFSILYALADPASSLCRAVLRQMSLA